MVWVLGPLLKSGLPLIGNVLEPLAKSVLMPLELTAVASETDAAIHKKMFGSGTTTLIIYNEEINDIMKIVKSLEQSGLLIKGVSQKIKNEAKEQKGGFLGMLFSTLGASLLGNILASKGEIATSKGREANMPRSSKEMIYKVVLEFFCRVFATSKILFVLLVTDLTSITKNYFF